jgi:hypothetical protein
VEVQDVITTWRFLITGEKEREGPKDFSPLFLPEYINAKIPLPIFP